MFWREISAGLGVKPKVTEISVFRCHQKHPPSAKKPQVTDFRENKIIFVPALSPYSYQRAFPLLLALCVFFVPLMRKGRKRDLTGNISPLKIGGDDLEAIFGDDVAGGEVHAGD
jgi:hypothetical protein